MFNTVKTIGIQTLLAVFLAVFVIQPVQAVPREVAEHVFPRKANYFLDWTLTEAKARQLAKWDLVVLDMEVQVGQAHLLKKMRQWNPNIVILAYITPQEIVSDSERSGSVMRARLGRRVSSSWHLKDVHGTQLSFWPGTIFLNASDRARVVNGKQWNSELADFVSTEILATGLWDGVFYDNAFDDVSWMSEKGVDLDANGRADTEVAASWQAGMKNLYTQTQQKTNNQYIIVGNGTTRAYRNELNGNMLENFITPSWEPTMNTYKNNFEANKHPQISIINANTQNGKTTQFDYKAMRFGLGSTLMEDGYYSFDYGDQDHGQLWWYDEYNLDLGKALGESVSKQGHQSYKSDIWQRQFENGIAIVNSKKTIEIVPLGGEYEKIHGKQDPRINDGSIVNEVQVSGEDGLLLLSTFSKLDNVMYKNGSFVRFFRPTGERVRNGFFASDPDFEGAEQVARVDVNGDKKLDKVAFDGKKIEIWKSDGQPYMKVYPYGANHTGEVRIRLADIDGDNDLEVLVAPGEGSSKPIQIYEHHGRRIVDDWYPFGVGYQGGYHLSAGVFEAGGSPSIVVGAGRGVEPRIFIYDQNLKKVRDFLAYERGFRGGVQLDVGDTNGDGIDEIVTGPGRGGKTWIRMYEGDGTSFGVNFEAHSAFGHPGIDIRLTDVDFDGKDDIIGISEGFAF